MKILLVVDLQQEFKLEPYYSQIIQFIKNNKQNYDKVVATRFLNTENSPFVQKLGYEDAMKRSKMEFPYDILFSKHTYECGNGFYKHIKQDDIDIVGCDTDACILAMCFEMFRYNMNFRLLADYCYSSGGDDYHNMALDIIYRNFGADSIVEHGTFIPLKEDIDEGI